MDLVGERNGYILGSYCNHCNGCSGCKNCIGCSICCNHNHTHIVQLKSDSKLGKQQQKEEWQVPWIKEIIILQLVSPKKLSKDILMAKTMRKNYLIIWITARNYLNSCLNVSWEENLTLAVYNYKSYLQSSSFGNFGWIRRLKTPRKAI